MMIFRITIGYRRELMNNGEISFSGEEMKPVGILDEQSKAT